MNFWHGTSGPPDSRIAIVGESWGQDELFEQKPFVGSSGRELDQMLFEAGLSRADIFCTNVFNLKPPRNEIGRMLLPYAKGAPTYRGLNLPLNLQAEHQRLIAQLSAYPRDLIIVAGNWPLWALTDNRTGIGSKNYDYPVREPTGITSWRASQIYSDTLPVQTKLLPIIHPAAILREWSWRQTTVQDLRRAHHIGDWEPREIPDIRIAKSAADVAEWFLNISLRTPATTPIRISNDIETYRGHITVVGFGHGNFDENGTAIVIPLVRALGNADIGSSGKADEEAQIWKIIRAVFRAKDNYLIEGQNYLYDTQYFIKWMGIEPTLDFDTMRAQHMLFPGTPKSLDYLSSLYCKYHRYWKEDGKEWAATGDQMAHLFYNGEDCLRTFECATVLRDLIRFYGMEEQWFWEKEKMNLALQMMKRGIRIDMAHRGKMRREVFLEQLRIHQRLSGLIPPSIVPKPKSSKKAWWESEAQQRDLFYEVLGLAPQTHRKTKRPTINDEALNTLEEKHPELSTIFGHLKAERSLGVFKSNFLEAEVDADGRMRSSFGVAETHRWTSSANVFGSGTNLQNIPAGDEE